MRNCVMMALLLTGIGWSGVASATTASCASGSDVIGTSRTISIDPLTTRRIGSLQFSDDLPLNDHEIVLTFDDGPTPAETSAVLDVLGAQCVKATFFVLGENVQKWPDLVRREVSEGHSVGTHTQTHPHLSELPLSEAKQEIDKGIEAASEAIGRNLSPFFRAPYLDTSESINGYLVSKGLVLWSIDFQADDWTDVPPDEVIQKAIAAIEEKKQGILLLHDIQERTASALPKLLAELNRKGYKIVHVVASPSESENRSRTVGQGNDDLKGKQ